MSRILGGAILGLALAGCNSGSYNAGTNSDNDHSGAARPLAESQPQINIVSANREVAVGDTSTFTVNSRNTLGRNARIEWASTSGKVDTEENGRIARVHFDQPGSNTVTAKLLIDDKVVDQDTVTINARPLH
jgi:hypothetical protein